MSDHLAGLPAPCAMRSSLPPHQTWKSLSFSFFNPQETLSRPARARPDDDDEDDDDDDADDVF